MEAVTSTVRRQIALPLSKAIEIAWKNIRMRLSRSLLVTSGIVLALAFLMAILANEAVVDSMRSWAAAPSATAAERLQRQKLESMMRGKGLPTTPQEIADARLQTRWLLGLALLVAFVGILNAMLMSVTERFREIGTMKCLGALDGFIVKLFLIESLFQGIVGTVIGVALGLGLSLLSVTATYGGFAWRDVPVGRLAGGVAMCLVVGVALTVAGAVYPAWQAARMQPIEAMRVET
jgi:predicted lysophospholipase L1 biosynthesis ABC-type transport system permease subunit